MNLIALKAFRNVKSLRLRGKDQKSTVEGSIHDDHVHKGARFAMGDQKTLADMHEADQATAVQVASLIAAGCVGEADNEDTVAAVAAEVKADYLRAKRDADKDAASNAGALGNQLLAAIAALQTKAAKQQSRQESEG